MPSVADRVPGELTVVATLENVRVLAAWLKNRCRSEGVVDALAFDLELALVEAANNCIEHGYAQTTIGSIGVAFEHSEDRVDVTLYDCGKAIPAGMLSECREVPLDSLSGRGMSIVRSCVDEIDYRSEGGLNVLVLTKRLA